MLKLNYSLIFSLNLIILNNMTVIISCIICKKQFLISPSRINKTKFCSRKCYSIMKRRKVYNQHLKKRTIKICNFCQKEFEVHNYRKDTAKYCSYKCKNKNNTEEKASHWKGNNVGYHGVHAWVEKTLGCPQKCFMCKTETAKKYEWANKNHKYKRVVKDWIRVCTSCHRIYDFKHN